MATPAMHPPTTAGTGSMAAVGACVVTATEAGVATDTEGLALAAWVATDTEELALAAWVATDTEELALAA
jgi:hypothetical protein